VTQVALGDDFSIALGLTLPVVDIKRLTKSNGVMRLKTEKSTEASQGISRIKKHASLNERGKDENKSSAGKVSYIKQQQENYAPLF